MDTSVKILTKFLLFIIVTVSYCICSLLTFQISSISTTLIFAILSLSFEFFVNYKFKTPHYIFMLASLAPAILHIIIFNFNPGLYIDGTQIALIIAAIRILLSIVDFIKTKKYFFIPISIVLAIIIFVLSDVIAEYQYNVLRELDIFLK